MDDIKKLRDLLERATGCPLECIVETDKVVEFTWNGIDFRTNLDCHVYRRIVSYWIEHEARLIERLLFVMDEAENYSGKALVERIIKEKTMTICGWCNKHMGGKISSCDENVKVDFGTSVMDPIKYGDETRAKFENERCHDCKVTKGGIHHPGCDVEECPKCHKQLISCGCLDEKDEQ